MSTVSVVAPGAMGSGFAHLLSANGVKVLTSLDGRSDATRERATAAGMHDATDAEIASADIILSVVPPAQAVALATRLAPALRAAQRKAIYVDCNAVSIESVKQVEAIIRGSGAAFVDGGIIGMPPKGQNKPTLYLSGADAGNVAVLGALGLKVEVVGEKIGAASALKMSFAGINKGMVFLVSAMILGAARAGAEQGLYRVLSANRPDLLARWAISVPDMFSKAHRWAPEMEEVAEFLGEGQMGQDLFIDLAKIGVSLAHDFDGEKVLIRTLDEFFKSPHSAQASQ
ncbi:hypothetical protein CAL29_30045 [Bordetella genomosp. 10]|uniref:6-phosphogluconate dehydrogenase n=1 Tax=Bordetella genomosp. 10 TaxID=1416804 RepID=A0A261S5D3_9BORD|nr:hypothetical protein CAL29_30045 [Bordetella genomosp. 10]